MTALVILAVFVVLLWARYAGRRYQRRRLLERIAQHYIPQTRFSFDVWDRGPAMANFRHDGRIIYTYPWAGWRSVMVAKNIDMGDGRLTSMLLVDKDRGKHEG